MSQYVQHRATKVITPTGTVYDALKVQEALDEGYHKVFLDGHDYIPWTFHQTVDYRRSGQSIEGYAPWATTIEWYGPTHRANVFRMSNALQCTTLKNCMIRPSRWGTSNMSKLTGGYAVVIGDKDSEAAGDAYCEIENVWTKCFPGYVLITGASECRISKAKMRNMLGKHGILFTGTDKKRSYRLIIEDVICDNEKEYPNPHISWITLDSYAYSLVIDKAALMNGGIGVLMQDTANTGDSYPMWVIANDIETDHTNWHGIMLTAGEGFQAGESWFGSSIEGCGLIACRDWRGDISLTGATRIFGNASHGIALMAGKVANLGGLLVGDNGNANPGKHAGLFIGGTADDVTDSGSFFGDCIGVKGNAQGWGAIINSALANPHIDLSSSTMRGNQHGHVLLKNCPLKWNVRTPASLLDYGKSFFHNVESYSNLANLPDSGQA